MLVGPSRGSTAAQESRPRAVLDAEGIPLDDVRRYHCHDRDYPVIRCFRDEAGRDADTARALGRVELLSDPYVTFYKDVGYGGGSYSAYGPLTNLGIFGWADVISSFKSLNNGRPHWYRDSNYGTPDWRWAAGAWVTNVGSAANDTFSSVENDP